MDLNIVFFFQKYMRIFLREGGWISNFQYKLVIQGGQQDLLGQRFFLKGRVPFREILTVSPL